MTKESEGCRYCKDIRLFDEHYFNYNTDIYIHTKENPTLWATAEDSYSYASFTINFCPCCGRRLRETLLEDIDFTYE